MMRVADSRISSPFTDRATTRCLRRGALAFGLQEGSARLRCWPRAETFNIYVPKFRICRK